MYLTTTDKPDKLVNEHSFKVLVVHEIPYVASLARANRQTVHATVCDFM